MRIGYSTWGMREVPIEEANLRARLEEYTPASMQAGIIYAS